MTLAWGEWLRDYPWDWFATLTCAVPVHPEQAAKRFARWVNTLEHHCGHRISWVRVLETQRRQVFHIHALLLGVAGLEPLEFMRRWEAIGGGMARIYPYDPRRGAAYYLAKGVATGAEIDLSPIWVVPLPPSEVGQDPDERGPA